MKKKVCLIITFIISLFVFCNRVDALYMWVECNSLSTEAKAFEKKDYLGHPLSRYYGYFFKFAVVNNNHNKPKLIAINGYGVFDPIVTDAKYSLFGEYKLIYEVQGPISIATDNGDICWLADTTDTKKTCGHNNLSDATLMLDNGYCPVAARRSSQSFNILLYGKTNSKQNSYQLSDTPRFIIYKFNTGNQTYIFAEGYEVGTGAYGYIRSNPAPMEFPQSIRGVTGTGDVMRPVDGGYTYNNDKTTWTGATQILRINNCGQHYAEISEQNYCALMASLAGSKESVGFELIYDSTDTSAFRSVVEKWYEENRDSLKPELATYRNVMGQEDKVFDVVNEINDAYRNGKIHAFEDDYSISNFIGDLEKAVSSLEKIHYDTVNKNLVYTTFSTGCKDKIKVANSDEALYGTFYCETFNKSIDQILNTSNNLSVNPDFLTDYIEPILINVLQTVEETGDADLISIKNEIEEYVISYTAAVRYLLNNSNNYSLKTDEINTLNNLKKICDKLLEELGIELVVDCESLLGTKLIKKIDKYMDIFKIFVPLILIGFGVIDFMKAIFTSDDNKMKKAQKDFILRIVIAILIFLCPYFLNLLLTIANEVWNFISPNSCGIF